MLTVHLKDVIIHAYHGLYEGEERTGNNFEVNLSVSYEAKKGKLDDLKHLISYEDLFRIVQKRMNTPTPLLEELADGIICKIHQEYSQVQKVEISIFKLQAPITGMQGKVGITLVRKF
ncbi:dihydroneopterin aldolase [Flavihumibacter rivuli]|uniref:dihydroneopterin aldolase n=1 Tax=Flavihumibacter rivuli TaxID=2838156 RepID=UPI001BDF3FB6|nr:dihydroneopterin aldolase [Flavihumibacter rivuli]ULQ57729.1 dihydroneopterin aldolase [Flavihumibacter rivuli]